MPDIHSIRLRHPWRCEPVSDGVRWLRAFNWPAGLTSRETARVVVEGLPAGAVVRLSGKPLVGEGDGVYDVTRLLAPFNELAIEVDGRWLSDDTECPFGVRLEIVEGQPAR